MRLLDLAYIAAVAYAQRTTAPACASTIQPQHPAPSLASGWRADVVASNLSRPRTVLFDSEGGLLVVEPLKGISRITLDDGAGPCVRSKGEPALVIEDDSVGAPPSLPSSLPISDATFRFNGTVR